MPRELLYFGNSEGEVKLIEHSDAYYKVELELYRFDGSYTQTLVETDNHRYAVQWFLSAIQVL